MLTTNKFFDDYRQGVTLKKSRIKLSDILPLINYNEVKDVIIRCGNILIEEDEQKDYVLRYYVHYIDTNDQGSLSIHLFPTSTREENGEEIETFCYKMTIDDERFKDYRIEVYCLSSTESFPVKDPLVKDIDLYNMATSEVIKIQILDPLRRSQVQEHLLDEIDKIEKWRKENPHVYYTPMDLKD